MAAEQEGGIVKRAVLYLRVSTVAQARRNREPEGYSIPAQREACQRKAASMGVEIVGEYVDRGESAKTADRPELQALLERVRVERDIDVVIVHKVDRLARNRHDDATTRRRDDQLHPARRRSRVGLSDGEHR